MDSMLSPFKPSYFSAGANNTDVTALSCWGWHKIKFVKSTPSRSTALTLLSSFGLSLVWYICLLKLSSRNRDISMSSLRLTLVLSTNFNLLSKPTSHQSQLFITPRDYLCPNYRSVDISHRVLVGPIPTPLFLVFLAIGIFGPSAPPPLHPHQSTPPWDFLC